MITWHRQLLLAMFVALNLGLCALAIPATPSAPAIPTTGSGGPTPALPVPALATPTLTALPATPTQIALETGFSDIALALPLTIRHVTETSASLYFELSQPASGIVIISETTTKTASAVVEFDDQEANHSITVEGLQPGVSYTAVIGLLNAQGSYNPPAYRGEVWGPVSFVTASEAAPLRVAVIGDAGMGDEVTPKLAAQMAEADPDFVIFTGDTVYNIPDNRDHYEAFALKYYEPFAPLLQTRPIYNVVGNHDVEAATIYQGTPFYYRAFPPFADPSFAPSDNQGRNQWYAFAYGDVQFLMLDSQTFYNEDGGETQIAWLQERLSDSRFAYSVPAFHIPPFTSGRHTYDGLGVRQQWLPLFESAHVPLVLSGHDHNYEHLESNGITYIVSGGGSSSLYAQQNALPESRFFAHQSNFVILDFYPDRIEVQAVALGGDLLDQFTIPLSQ